MTQEREPKVNKYSLIETPESKIKIYPISDLDCLKGYKKLKRLRKTKII